MLLFQGQDAETPGNIYTLRNITADIGQSELFLSAPLMNLPEVNKPLLAMDCVCRVCESGVLERRCPGA